jgi:hypothetical protein
MKEEMCLVDSCTANSIFRETKYFQTLTQRYRNVLTIAGCDATIVGSGRSTITFPDGNDRGCFIVSRFYSYPHKF